MLLTCREMNKTKAYLQPSAANMNLTKHTYSITVKTQLEGPLSLRGPRGLQRKEQDCIKAVKKYVTDLQRKE